MFSFALSWARAKSIFSSLHCLSMVQREFNGFIQYTKTKDSMNRALCEQDASQGITAESGRALPEKSSLLVQLLKLCSNRHVRALRSGNLAVWLRYNSRKRQHACAHSPQPAGAPAMTQRFIATTACYRVCECLHTAGGGCWTA